MAGFALKVPCTIVMPVATPSIKWRNVERLGAKIVLHGQDFDEAKAECNRLAKSFGLLFLPPFDDPFVIAGQGTIGVELARQVKDFDSLDGIFSSVGGGGLLAGIAAYVKRLAPESVKVVGVEPEDGPSMKKSLDAGRRVQLKEVGLFSDGTAVKIVGEETFRVCKELVDDIVLVNNDQICAAIKDIFEGESLLWYLKSASISQLIRPPLINSQRLVPSLNQQAHSHWPVSKLISIETISSEQGIDTLRSFQEQT